MAFVAVYVAMLLAAKQNRQFSDHQQRQIDQICAVMPSLVWADTPEDQRPIYKYNDRPSGDYSLWFANYKVGEALMVYWSVDPAQRYDGKRHFVLVKAIPPDILKDWPNGETRKWP